MKKRIRLGILILVAAMAAESWALYILRPAAGRWRFEAVIQDEPAAHARYDQMMAALHSAGSLSYRCSCSSPGERAEQYLLWLKKPNCFRVEAGRPRRVYGHPGRGRCAPVDLLAGRLSPDRSGGYEYPPRVVVVLL